MQKQKNIEKTYFNSLEVARLNFHPPLFLIYFSPIKPFCRKISNLKYSQKKKAFLDRKSQPEHDFWSLKFLTAGLEKIRIVQRDRTEKSD